MQKFLLGVDQLSTWVGHLFAWTIVILTLSISYEVFARYLFNAPTTWVFDMSYVLYGTLFMMAGAYTLARNGHVRGDFIYRRFQPRTQATLDLVLYFLFFFPGILAFMYSGWNFFVLSYGQMEKSIYSPIGFPIWPYKGLIPVVGVLMFIQGVAEVIRCVITIRTNEPPRRLHDVEETEKIILENAEQGGDAQSATAGGKQ